MCAARKIDRATWNSPTSGTVYLNEDWTHSTLPPLGLAGTHKGIKLQLGRKTPLDYAKISGYSINEDWITFVAPIDHPEDTIYLAGGWNGWAANKNYEMQPQEMEGRTWAVLTVSREAVGEYRSFKFVTHKGDWLAPNPAATNITYEGGVSNYIIDYRKSGRHLVGWTLEGADWTDINELRWSENGHEEQVEITPGYDFYEIKSDRPQGAIIEENGQTTFRIFAPRAKRVKVHYGNERWPEVATDMVRDNEGCWSVTVAENLENYDYYYTLDGPRWSHTGFDKSRRVLDPWALAVRNGIGVVVDKKKLIATAPQSYSPPPYQDLIITEAHIQDLLAKAPLELSEAERKGYGGINKLIEWPDNPITLMGANALELLPVAEFDEGVGKGAYHWGYMPINFFAPASAYGSAPDKLSQLREMQQMVEALHKQNVAVILDVVYNHYGEPAAPYLIDKAYYLRLNAAGGLQNFSGCGNDYRIESAMAERMVLEAMEHWVRAYGVDGFRFDLAELLGKRFLERAQKHMQAIKPDIILIAEPWSFRGHIGAELKNLDYISWNDGYREAVPEYLRGRRNAEGMKYFVQGSVGGVNKRPVQSLNYVESHDDRTWIDKITQNPNNNGYYPTLNDRRLTHLMGSLMTMSLGVPMWAAGMEAMRSKYGVNNTYLRGDLNAIEYGREREHANTVEYFRGLNMLRRGPLGQALRIRELPEDYIKFYETAHMPALGVLYNAAGKEKCQRILYVINPANEATKIYIADLDAIAWKQVADHERVDTDGLPFGRFIWANKELEVPGVSAGIFVEQV